MVPGWGDGLWDVGGDGAAPAVVEGEACGGGWVAGDGVQVLVVFAVVAGQRLMRVLMSVVPPSAQWVRWWFSRKPVVGQPG